MGAVRAAVGEGWLAIGMAYVAGVFVFFVFGLSRGLLSYFHAAISTLGLLLLLLVLEKLTERGWHDAAPAGDRPGGSMRGAGRVGRHRMRWGVALWTAVLTRSVAGI